MFWIFQFIDSLYGDVMEIISKLFNIINDADTLTKILIVEVGIDFILKFLAKINFSYNL